VIKSRMFRANMMTEAKLASHQNSKQKRDKNALPTFSCHSFCI